MTASYLWNPPPVYSLPVRGKSERLPVNRIFLVGRNYHAHAVQKSDIDKLIWNVRADRRPVEVCTTCTRAT